MLSIYKGFESELSRLEKSCCYENSYPQKRKPEQVYATIEVVSCQHDLWWYKDLIGMEFFCRLVFYFDRNRSIKYLKDAEVIALTNTKQITGRSFSPDDIIIL